MHGACVLTSVAIDDADAFARYRAEVAQVNARLGGEMVIRGSVREVIEGAGAVGEVIVAIGFADAAQARAYIASPEYQALAALRERAGKFTIRIVA